MSWWVGWVALVFATVSLTAQLWLYEKGPMVSNFDWAIWGIAVVVAIFCIHFALKLIAQQLEGK